MQQIQLVSVVLLFVLWVVFSIKPVAAAGNGCTSQYEELDATLDRLLANRHETAPSLYDVKLLALEDALFKSFGQCPDEARLFALMGELQIVLGQPSLAVAYGNRAVKLDALSWRGHYVRGTALCLSGQCESGLESLRHAVGLQPGNAALQLNLCSVLVWNSLHQESLPECTRVIQAGDETVLGQAYYLRSQAHSSLGNAEQAAADLAQAKYSGFNAKRDTLQIVKPESIPPGVVE
jgi:predicted Zn-dependent protease